MGDGGLDLVFEVRVKLGRVVDDPWLGKLANDLRLAALNTEHVEGAEIRVDATAHLLRPMSAVDKALEHVTEGRLRLRERVARRQFDPEEVRRVINDALAEYFAIPPGYASLNCWAHDRPRPCAECDEAAAQAVPPVPFGSKGKTLLEEKGLAGPSPPPGPPTPPRCEPGCDPQGRWHVLGCAVDAAHDERRERLLKNAVRVQELRSEPDHPRRDE